MKSSELGILNSDKVDLDDLKSHTARLTDTLGGLTSSIDSLSSWEQVLKLINGERFTQYAGEDLDDETIYRLLSSEISRLLGYPLIGNGASRCALDIGDYCLKVPICITVGTEENELESKAWNLLQESEYHFRFPVVLHSSPRYLLVEKVSDFQGYEDFRFYQQDASKILSELRDAGFDFSDVYDNRHTQWGLRGSNLVILDSASLSIQ